VLDTRPPLSKSSVPSPATQSALKQQAKIAGTVNPGPPGFSFVTIFCRLIHPNGHPPNEPEAYAPGGRIWSRLKLPSHLAMQSPVHSLKLRQRAGPSVGVTEPRELKLTTYTARNLSRVAGKATPLYSVGYYGWVVGMGLSRMLSALERAR